MRRATMLLVAFSLSLTLDSLANGQPQFFEKFQDLYARKAAPEYQEKAKTAKCNLCHVQGEPKKVRNEYGAALKRAGLDKQQAKDLKDPDKAQNAKQAIEDAFKKAEEEKANDGRKFGERIKAGELPASDSGPAK